MKLFRRLIYALCYMRLGYRRDLAWSLAAEGRPQVPQAQRLRSYAHDAIQAGILIFGAAGAWLITEPAGSSLIFWGFCLLLIAQAFWFADVFRGIGPLRWGVLINVIAYTGLWARGFYNYF